MLVGTQVGWREAGAGGGVWVHGVLCVGAGCSLDGAGCVDGLGERRGLARGQVTGEIELCLDLSVLVVFD